MSDEHTEPVRNPRYFAKDGEGVQAVYNLRSDAPYLQLGYTEVDEQTYRASLPDPIGMPGALLAPTDTD